MRVSSYFQPVSVTGSEVAKLGNGIYKGQIQKVIFPDETESVSKIYVEYDILVELGPGTSTFKGVASLSALGGANDYSELVLEPAEIATTGDNEDTNTFQNRNGSIVAVAFFNGNFQWPVIIGAYTHPAKDRRTKADGISYVQVFRGVKTEINKDGEWSITYQSPYSPDGKLIAEDTGPTMLKIDKEGNFNVVLSKDEESIINTKFSREEKVTMTFKSGLVVTIDGANDSVKIETKGGAHAQIDGTSGTIELKDNGTGKLKITGDKVALGASSAELLQQISDSLQKLITWANSVGAVHDHIGNLGYPTAPPTQASGYTSLGSDLSTIKGLVDGVKGTL